MSYRILTLLVCGFASIVNAQAIGPQSTNSLQSLMPKIQQFGIDGFRLMLQKRGLNAQPRFVGSALNKAPTKTVAIILGDLRTVAPIRNQLNTFVLKGGSLLVASDLKSPDPRPVPKSPILNTWVRRTRLMSNAMCKQYGFRGLNDCPIVTRFKMKDSTVLLDGVTSIVCNRPGEIEHGRGVTPICWLPTGPPLMTMYDRGGKGRMLFIADHSIFINEMLVHGDNAKFVSNVTEWLCEDGQRTTLVLIHNGQVLDNWKFGENLPPIPLSSLLRAAKYGGLADLPMGDSAWEFLNESIARSQREDEFNIAVERTGTLLAGGRRRGVRAAVLVTSVFTLLGLTVWLATTRSTPRRWLSFQDWNQPRRLK